MFAILLRLEEILKGYLQVRNPERICSLGEDDKQLGSVGSSQPSIELNAIFLLFVQGLFGLCQV